MTPEEKELSIKISEVINGIKELTQRLESLEKQHKKVTNQMNDIGKQLEDDTK